MDFKEIQYGGIHRHLVHCGHLATSCNKQARWAIILVPKSKMKRMLNQQTDYTPCTPLTGCCREQSCQSKPTICRGLHFQQQVKSTSWIRTAMECCPAFAISSQFTVSTKHRSGFFSTRTLPRKMFVNAYSPNSCNITRSETHHIHIRFCLKTHFMTVQNRTEFLYFHSECLSCRLLYGWPTGPLCRLWVIKTSRLVTFIQSYLSLMMRQQFLKT
jgi:hypothetical protein